MDESRENAPSRAPVSLSMALLRTMRPKQWTKNLVVFIPLFFTVNEAWRLSDLAAGAELLARSVGAFAIFSAASGAIYIVNDLADVNNDRSHPRKKHRPIASGDLASGPAAVAACAVIIVAVGAAFALEPRLAGVVLGYVLTMVAYSWVLKSIILVDVFAISAGFVLRVVAGAAALGVPISIWLYVCTGLGALFIALSKRRSELAVAGELAAGQRGLLVRYSLTKLDQLIAVAGVSSLVSYTLYTLTASNLPDNNTMMLTIPFVAFGLSRYMYLVRVLDRGENPEEVVITDLPMILTIVLWIMAGASILVAFRA
jgi:4-hydroxybenzoate polyprenyltransferase